jgi:hypothetical protein
MQNQRAIKKIKLLVILSAAAFICSSLAWQKTQATAEQEEPQRRLEIVGVSVPFAERMGTDDGAAFVVHFIGSTHGSLEPCG